MIKNEKRLEWIRAKYDSGAASEALFVVMKSIGSELSWREYARQESQRA